MAMNAIIALLLMSVSETLSVVGPLYPPNTLSGGTVVAMLRVTAGSVKRVDIMQGDQPFVDPVRSALGAWRFKDSGSGNVLVVVNFRSPNMYSNGSPARNPSSPASSNGPLLPQKVIEPVYPPNSLGEGSVILHMGINNAGSVTQTEVVQGLGNLTDACVSAVKKWQFSPARSVQGASAVSDAYAVCVMRRPVLHP